ncbi:MULTISPECIES: aldehyde dehydrogenase family protein [Pseudomonas]|uniref:aldehyde dehydrogenase family protein n=1 Tax=Pseudomonas TaxID=286 RepID=UPI0023615B8B|nr:MULTISPECIES: aldehyde dehydrogenase family protein [Pseudomonas]WJV27619.1 aldehyde dehydrogenase family protein [Pseudomonas chlororaphis]
MVDNLFINGCWVRPTHGGKIVSIDPATETVIQSVGSATEDDIDLAVRAARSAFSGDWGNLSGYERAYFLNSLADDLEQHREELSVLEVRDNGKPLSEAQRDVSDAVSCFRYYAVLARELDELQDEPNPLSNTSFECRVRHEAIGVVGLILPWNNPLLSAAKKVAPALAAGAACVLKPSELTPLTALQLGAAAERVGLPGGALNIVPGCGKEAGHALGQHPGVDKVVFSGSVPTGAKVMSAAVSGIKNVSLELGGKSAFIVFDDADIEAAVEWVMCGIFWNQGQIYSATSRLLVQREIAPRLLERLVEAARSIKVGSGLEPGVQMGPLVGAEQYRKVMSLISHGVDEATLVSGGGRPSSLCCGYFVEPTIFDEPDADSFIWTEDIFGPVLCVKRFNTELQAVSYANDRRYGFAAAVMSADTERAARVANALRAGIVWINCSQPTFIEAPSGGVRHSGGRRALGWNGLADYLEVKQVTRYVSSMPWRWY